MRLLGASRTSGMQTSFITNTHIHTRHPCVCVCCLLSCSAGLAFAPKKSKKISLMEMYGNCQRRMLVGLQEKLLRGFSWICSVVAAWKTDLICVGIQKVSLLTFWMKFLQINLHSQKPVFPLAENANQKKKEQLNFLSTEWWCQWQRRRASEHGWQAGRPSIADNNNWLELDLLISLSSMAWNF